MFIGFMFSDKRRSYCLKVDRLSGRDWPSLYNMVMYMFDNVKNLTSLNEMIRQKLQISKLLIYSEYHCVQCNIGWATYSASNSAWRRQDFRRGTRLESQEDEVLQKLKHFCYEQI